MADWEIVNTSLGDAVVDESEYGDVDRTSKKEMEALALEWTVGSEDHFFEARKVGKTERPEWVLAAPAPNDVRLHVEVGHYTIGEAGATIDECKQKLAKELRRMGRDIVKQLRMLEGE